MECVGEVEVLSLCLATRPAVTPETLWQAWSFAPVITGPLLLVLAVYLWTRPRDGGWLRPACFLAGWTLLALALVSPLCRMAATLAWAHMVQHVILVAVAPPLLVLGGLPQANARMPGGPVAASVLYGVAIWVSHAPAVYQGALADAVLHTLVVFGLVAVSVQFWRTVLAQAGGAALMAVFLAMLLTGVLGALLTFSPTPWYPVFTGGVAAWGLTPLEDQQLAGLIMWVPMGAIYLVAGLGLAAKVVFGRGREAQRDGMAAH